MIYTSDEVKSGALISAALVLLFSLIFIVGGFVTGETRTYEIRFGYIGGLEKNAPVYFAGHEVGKVDSIHVVSNDEKPVYLTIRVDSAVKLREGSEGYVDMLGLMGEKIVEISPGPAGAPFLEEGALLEGTDPIPGHVLIRKMDRVADNMDSLQASLNPIVSRMSETLTESQADLIEMVANFKESSENIRTMTNDLKRRPWRLVRKGKPNEE
jgi:phospholipid/cholesterol/gamma-HCH transport system substrate-binding protein